MAFRRTLVLVGGILVVLSCTRATVTPTPAPGSGAGGGTTASAGSPPLSQTGAGAARRPPPSRDSAAKLRTGYVAQIMQSIAGRENQPADQVFKNVQVLKSLTAAELVHKMDTEYGHALSWSCTNCHRLANQGNWASDTAQDKKRARAMQIMVNDINQTYL